MKTSTADRPDPGKAIFPREAWPLVSLEAAETLELFGEQNRGHLKVVVTNRSSQMLDPGSGGELAFSYRLLDQNGRVLPCEEVRTPVSAPIPPGASHRQTVTVIVSGDQLERGTAVRVGLLLEGLYWVDSVFPGHSKMVRIHNNDELGPAEARLAAASQIWTQGRGNGLRWPYGSMMVAESHKLLYIPVAKCACTSLKSLMVKLAGVDRADIAIELDVHFITDRFNTGVQLKDRTIDAAREILASGQYFKFSVIRDPFERLVSAYLEKFVYNRHIPRNLLHIRPVLSAIQGTADIDLQRGISFDQFVDYILHQDPFELDPHWRPQYLYFRGVPHISRIFRLENIGELERYLLQNHGVTVQLGHKNRTMKSDISLPGAPQMSACELDEQAAISPESFVSSENRAAIQRYYREDFQCYDAAS